MSGPGYANAMLERDRKVRAALAIVVMCFGAGLMAWAAYDKGYDAGWAKRRAYEAAMRCLDDGGTWRNDGTVFGYCIREGGR